MRLRLTRVLAVPPPARSASSHHGRRHDKHLKRQVAEGPRRDAIRVHASLGFAPAEQMRGRAIGPRELLGSEDELTILLREEAHVLKCLIPALFHSSGPASATTSQEHDGGPSFLIARPCG